MIAEGIAAALDRYPGIVAIGVATTAEETERRGEQADAVAIDPYFPGAQVLAAGLRQKGARVVFLGGIPGEEDEGIRVPTTARIADLAAALIPNVIAPVPMAPRLTPREQEILELVAGGLAAKQVARHLGISAKTVEQHKSHIFAKFGVPNQTAAVSFALGNGLDKRKLWNRSST